MNLGEKSILIATSEFSPFAKTGGLGDMVPAFAAGLRRAGHDVRVVMPLYAQVRQSGLDFSTALPQMCVKMGRGEVWCAVHNYVGEDGVPLYMIEHDHFFNRSGLYQDLDHHDYPDNPYRFGFFSKAVLQLAMDLQFEPDILQVNDWQTALIPAYLKTCSPDYPLLGKCATVLTIHNESFKGYFPEALSQWLGLPYPDYPQDPDSRSFLQTGIIFADAVNTVSPTHAEEMKAPTGGFGLAPDIARKGELFRGVLNGVDYDVWSPEKDELIPDHYSIDNMSGKGVCKTHLQREFHLEEKTGIALMGFIGRLTEQKGVQLLEEVIEPVIRDMVTQFVLLGSGNPESERHFASLSARYPGKIGAHIGFNNRLAHLIEAGADFFLMPSIYEPCGLNQLYSLRYGALPIVHATGGLEDTVDNYDEISGKGTGFKFYDPTVGALYYTIGWAVSTYYDRPQHLCMLREQAMKQDYGWARSIRAYEDLFALAIKVKNKEINMVRMRYKLT
ncbi:MAG: glycogen synthase [Syntrophales bacterium]